MIRDMIDSILLGGILSFAPFWIKMTVPEQITVAAGLAVICYIVIQGTRELIRILQEGGAPCLKR